MIPICVYRELKQSNLLVVIIKSLALHFANIIVLADFITPCKGTDPDLNDCATIAANKVIPILVKGK